MADPKAPTARELEIIFVAFQCLKETPQIDFAKLASTGIYKNAHSASSNWSTLRKKIFRADGVPVLATGGTGTGSAQPRTPRKSTATSGASTPKTDGKGKGRGKGKGKGGKAGNEGLSTEIVIKGDSDSDSDGIVGEEVRGGVKRERDGEGEGEGDRGEQETKQTGERGGNRAKKVKTETVEDDGATEEGHDGMF